MGLRKARVAVRAPLHGRAHAVAIAQVDIIAHANLIAVVEHRRPGSENSSPCMSSIWRRSIVEQRGEAAANAEVELRFRVVGIGPVHVVTFFLRHHLQREFVMIPQEDGPLAGLGDGRRLLENIDNREAIFHAERHKQARHEREMKDHMALVARAKVGHRLLRPLIGFGQEHALPVVLVDMAPHAAERRMGFRQILAGGALPLEEIGHRIQPKPIDAHPEPKVDDLDDGLAHGGVVIIQVGLVGIEAMPVIGVRHRIPAPVGRIQNP